MNVAGRDPAVKCVLVRKVATSEETRGSPRKLPFPDAAELHPRPPQLLSAKVVFNSREAAEAHLRSQVPRSASWFNVHLGHLLNDFLGAGVCTKPAKTQ